MFKKNTYFEYAQSLSNQYSTILSEALIEEKLLEIFNGQLPIDKENFNMTAREFLNTFLLQNYPNETAVKSTFINNILFKTRNHVSIFELNVGQSRLDLCKISTFSTAFEIKTDLDTPQRLKQQLDDYFKVFEKVYIICSINNVDNMINYTPKECGIYTYRITRNGRYIFKKTRTAQKSNNISSSAQLSILTKRELSTYFTCPYLENKDDMIERILNTVDNEEINKNFKICLKNKFQSKWEYLVEHSSDILEIDYQWFFKNNITPEIVYL
ncbi:MULTISPECIES: sce7726 family protein [Lysinibacillus]|uniref:sce7726 family protein n=1 Tax=Lysinibacillus TaxID=400634 RepID=UPI00214B3EEA|nr:MULTISPECIES: sce7726 family protein [Lysinibacillus]UUV27094.1 sce7726 family protein [Lysinibacillus sp. FN11]UYB45356.1 sce7726 family protein [Lysinibacillus capsici]